MNLSIAIDDLRAGKVIMYPTEAVFGLGCDPFNRAAVEQLLILKQRSVDQGVILIAAGWDQVADLVEDDMDVQPALDTWPGPVTWVIPTSAIAPAWITGQHHSIAVRITDHPVAAEICRAFGGPIVSTSANRHGKPPAKTAQQASNFFPELTCIDAPVGSLDKPTPIFDLLTKTPLRQ